MNREKDTIAAISTPVGTGGIAVVRVSGPLAIETVDALFRHPEGIRKGESHRAYVGMFLDRPGGEVLDRVVVTLFRAPHSYTGEDVVEVSCHGGRYLAQLILESVLAQGVRLAEPGEFTRRAFLNGRLDLAQAEAVADLIQAKTRQSVKYAARQLQGGISRKIRDIRQRLVALLANVELELDFSEEEIEIVPRDELRRELEDIRARIDALVASYRTGRMIREGVRVVIAGKPNVGKSSLFNAILGFERAIVDETPGTTRDALEAQLDIGGTLFLLVDTAGLRRPAERIERKGIEITQEHLRQADLILLLQDASRGISEEDEKIVRQIREELGGERRSDGADGLVIWNKVDLVETRSVPSGNPLGWPEIRLSARTGEGLDELHGFLSRYVTSQAEEVAGAEGEVVTNLRHVQALRRAAEALQKAEEGILGGLSGEFVAVDLREALEAIGEIVGKTTPDDVLNYIFENFCIGK